MVDYKTRKGASRRPAESSALFQMKFYAVAMWRGRGVVPSRLRLLFLGDGQVLDYTPTSTSWPGSRKPSRRCGRESRLPAATAEFPPNPGRMCNFCNHKSRCPAFGGTLPVSGNAAAGQSAGRIAQSIDEVQVAHGLPECPDAVQFDEGEGTRAAWIRCVRAWG